MFIINNSFTLHHPMREHRIQLDTLDARWGRYHALISRSDKLQRKSVLTPSSVIAVIEHSSSIRPHIRLLTNSNQNPSLSLYHKFAPCGLLYVFRSTGSMCMYIGHV